MEYITAEDRARLETEIKECQRQRKTLSKRIEEAREHGDLRENAEYHAAQEDQGLNEARIRRMEERLATAIVAGEQPVPDDMVFLGATVRLRNVDSGAEERYRLVGSTTDADDDDCLEVTPGSPLGEALMKARLGEVVRVDLRRGPKRFEIVEIVKTGLSDP